MGFTNSNGPIAKFDHGVLHIILLTSCGSSTKVYVNNIETTKIDDNNFIHNFANTDISGLVDVKI